VTALMMPFNKCTVLPALGLALSLVTSAALADVVAIVSSKSTITALSKSQIADIFFGKTGYLPDGVRPVPIDQAEGSAARKEFYLKVADKSAAQMKAYWSKIIFTGRGQPPEEVRDSAEMKKRLVENLAAIGYIEVDMVDATVRVLQTQ
jgi:ABC-type phosphate transport system substrate-binding protein